MAVTKAYSDWYDRNKAYHNARRRAKYNANTDYRENLQNKQRARRELKKEVPASSLLTIKDAAHIANISPSQIRGFELSGYFPKAVDKNGYRRYTLKQCHMIKDFAVYASSLSSTTQILRSIGLEAKAKEIAGVWHDS